MKCVPIKPLVESPQTKNEPNKYQKSFFLLACLRVSIANAPAPIELFAGSTQSAGAPYGRTPASCGRSLRKSQTNGINASATKVIDKETLFQPFISARCDNPGKKISCPVAELAVSAPMTIPRF